MINTVSLPGHTPWYLKHGSTATQFEISSAQLGLSDGKDDLYLVVSSSGIGFKFDKQGKLHAIIIEGGLVDDSYSLNDWKTVLPLVGIHASGEPEKTAQTGIRWNNLEGYQVALFADGISSNSHIDMIQISTSQ